MSNEQDSLGEIDITILPTSQTRKLVGGAVLMNEDGTTLNTVLGKNQTANQAFAEHELRETMQLRARQMSGELAEGEEPVLINKKTLQACLNDPERTKDLPEHFSPEDLPDDLKELLDMFSGDRFGTGGEHVGTDLENKTGWREGALNEAGDDPLKDRDFKGHEFQRLLGFGPAEEGEKARPAFWDHFRKIDENGQPLLDANGEEMPIESVDDLKGQKLKLYLGDEVPDFLKDHDVLETIESMDIDDGEDERHRLASEGEEPDGPGGAETDEPNEKAPTTFGRVHPNMEKVIRESVALSENSGIEVEIVDKQEDAHITVLGFERGDQFPRLLGVASFGDPMNGWESLEGLGQPRGQGFAFLNNDYANLEQTTDRELDFLFKHECIRGHNMSMCHTHDLGNPDMSQAATHAYTLMAYADMNPGEIEGKDELRVGAVDASAREWVPEPKAINTGAGKVYDMEAHAEQSFQESKDTQSAQRSGLLPAAAIVDHGTDTELHGTKGDDYIDTNPGYTSSAKKEYTTRYGREIELEQKFLLTEGHISKVRGIEGNNIIVPSDIGDQVIEPGTGENEIRFVHNGINSDTKIVSEGKDSLVLRMDKDKSLEAQQVDGNLTIKGDNGSITLEGNEIANIRVINAKGKELVNVETKGMDADAINTDVLEAARTELAKKPAKKDKTKDNEKSTGEEKGKDDIVEAGPTSLLDQARRRGGEMSR